MTSEMGKDVNEVATAVSDIRPVDLLGSTGLLENAIRSALAAVVVIDGSGKIRGWSGTAQKAFGWAAEEVLGRQLTGFIIPERYRAAHRRGLRRFKQTGRGRVVGQVLELAAIDRDGREFPVEIAINPLAGLEGEPVFVAYIRDISDRKAAEEGQAALAAELEHSRESLREFIGLIVHELRAPLGVAHGYLDMLADGSLGPLPTRIRAALTMIRQKNQEAQRLVEQLLLAARVETNALGVVLASIDISSVLSEAASRAEGLVKLKGTALDVDTGGPVMATADGRWVRTIVDNLIVNAVIHGRPTQIRLSSGIDPVPWVRVSDDGRGIPLAAQATIFDRFVRVEDRSSAPGTGLGLYLGRLLAKNQGGRLLLERSAPGEGSTFRLDLAPAAEPAH